MIVLLISWVCGSVVLCLALLGIAARAVPRPEEQTAAGRDPALGREPAIGLGETKPTSRPAWIIPAPPPLLATTKTANSLLSPVPKPSHRAVLACQPGV